MSNQPQKTERQPCGGPTVEATRRAIGCQCESMAQPCNCGKITLLLVYLSRTHEQLFRDTGFERASQVEARASQVENSVPGPSGRSNETSLAKGAKGGEVVGGNGEITGIAPFSITSEQNGPHVGGNDLERAFCSNGNGDGNGYGYGNGYGDGYGGIQS